MAEVLVIGKKISEMGLVNDITGEEKIPTSALGDKAVTTSQLLTYVNNNGVAQWGRIGGDITNQVDLQNQFTQERNTLKSYTQGLVSQQQVALQEYIDVTDVAFRYIHENGSALPYKEGISYEEGAVVVKDGVLQQWKGGEWRSAVAEGLLDAVQTFNTPEAGVDPVTGIADGAYFNVRSSSDESYGDEYQNVGGVPVATGKSYPSSAALTDVKEIIVDPSTGKATASKVYTESGQDLQILSDIFKRKLDNILYASDFDINGDGTDEAAKVQLMFNSIRPSTIVDFEGKTVICGKQVAITTKRNFRLENGYIKASPLSTTSVENRVMFLNVCSNFVLSNFDFDGNRENRTPQEKSIHTLVFRECKNFFCFNVNAWNSVCDGFYFDCRTPLIKETHTQNGFFFNCKTDNAYRNSAAIIVGRDLHFNNCEFTGANGTLPMAGVDLESNGYGGDGIIENIFFNNCKFKNNVGWQIMVTHHDNPRNIFVNGGEITAPNVSDKWMLNKALVPAGTAGATQLPDASNCGGCQVTNPDTTLFGVTFKDFPLGSGTGFRVAYSDGGHAKLLSCKFINMHKFGTNLSSFNPATVSTHATSDGVYIADKTEFYDCANGVALFNRNDIVQDSLFVRSAGLGLNTSAVGAQVLRNVFRDGTGRRCIFSEAEDSVIMDNRLYDMTSDSPIAFIQSDTSGAVVERNICSMSTATTMNAIRFDAQIGRSLRDNAVVNAGNTPYYILNGHVLNGAVIANNTGGTQRLSTPVALRAFTTPNRPEASAVPRYSEIFDTTLKQKLISDGTNWLDATGASV